MRSLVLLAAILQFASALPQFATNGSTSKVSPALVPTNTTAPTACKNLAGDSKWPTDAEWKAALPNAIKRGPQNNESTKPDYHFSALSAADVQRAVTFASKHDIRLSVITTGHDFMARNDAPSGLGLSLEKLRGVRVAQSFEPSAKGEKLVDFASDPVKGANKISPVVGRQAAVTFGAGVTTQELNNALDPSLLFTMGAAHGEVSVAGGWGQAGGHGPLTSKYGLGVDQVLEYQVVTADGQLRIANAVSNPDLFWALRGGGGGTFGVVVQATLKALPTPAITATLWWMNTTDTNDKKSVFAPTADLMSQLPDLNKRGVQGYFYIYPNAIQGIFFLAGEDSGEDKAKALWKPYLENLSKFKGMASPIQEHVELPNYKIFFDAAFGPLESHGATMGMPAASAKILAGKRLMTRGFMRRAQEHRFESEIVKRHGPDGDDDDMAVKGGPGLGPKSSGLIPLDSRFLMPEHLMASNLTDVLEASFPKMANAMFRGHLTSGGKVWETDRDGSETSVHPAWRKSLVHILGSGTPGRVIPDLSPLKRLAANTGAYSNEASWQEENWKSTFFGSHYPKLLSIKEKYDPNYLFYVTPGIGADKMVVSNGRLCPTQTPVVTANNRVPESDNRNIGKAATGNDFLTLWPSSQEFADKELGKAKDALVGAALAALGLGGMAPAGPAVVAAPPPAGDAPKPPRRV